MRKKSGNSQRTPSKLQKQQSRSEASPTPKSALITTQAQPNNAENVPPANSSLRMVETESRRSPDKAKDDVKPAAPKPEPKSQKLTRVKQRVELDEFEEEDEEVSEPTRAPPEPEQIRQTQQPDEPPQPQQSQPQQPQPQPQRPTLPGAYPDSYLSTQTSSSQQQPALQQQQKPEPEAADVKQSTLQPQSDSPVSVSPVSPVTTSKPPALMADTSSQEDRSSPISSPSPELPDPETRTHRNQDSTTTTTSTATTASTWNDTNLRAFFDSGSEIRDLLTVVYDKSDVPPVGPEHPVAGLFREPNAKLAEITTVSATQAPMPPCPPAPAPPSRSVYTMILTVSSNSITC